MQEILLNFSSGQQYLSTDLKKVRQKWVVKNCLVRKFIPSTKRRHFLRKTELSMISGGTFLEIINQRNTFGKQKNITFFRDLNVSSKVIHTTIAINAVFEN